MKSLIGVGFIFFALSFCGLGERLKDIAGGRSNSNVNSPASNTQPAQFPPLPPAEKASLTAEQETLLASGSEVAMDEQKLSWRLPSGWKSTDNKSETPIFSSSDGAFLIPTISSLRPDFPIDVAIQGALTTAEVQGRSGKYEMVRLVEIDGVMGVETIEAMPKDKGDPRRHQWIGYRKYNDATQQINIILSTKGSNFDKHRSDFPAILYSMRIGK